MEEFYKEVIKSYFKLDKSYLQYDFFVNYMYNDKYDRHIMTKIVDNLVLPLEINFGNHQKGYKICKKFIQSLNEEEYTKLLFTVIKLDYYYSEEYYKFRMVSEILNFYESKDILAKRIIIDLLITITISCSKFLKLNIDNKRIRPTLLPGVKARLPRDKRLIGTLAVALVKPDTEGYKKELIDILTSKKEFLINQNLIQYKCIEAIDPEMFNMYTDVPDVFDIIVTQEAKNVADKKINYYNEDLINILRTRKYLLPNKGVMLTDIENSNLDKVILYEREFNKEFYIVAIYNTCNCTQSALAINLTNPNIIRTSFDESEVLALIYNFYGVDLDSLPNHTKKEGAYHINYHVHMDITKEIKKINRALILNPITHYKVLQPYYWRYKNAETSKEKTYNINEVDNRAYIKEQKYISAFKKKLPIGYKASEDAKELARRYCITLEQGETLVSPHTKTVRVLL